MRAVTLLRKSRVATSGCPLPNTQPRTPHTKMSLLSSRVGLPPVPEMMTHG